MNLARLLALASFYVVFVAAAAPSPDLQLDRAILSGKRVYDQHCSACHGETGQGNGPAAVWLFPKPRDFSAGLFKIQSTPAGSLPNDGDLLETVTRGMPGSSMPSFTFLSDAERRDAVNYVKWLTAYVDGSGRRINRFDEAKANNVPMTSIEAPPEPPATLQALSEGKELFTRLQCFTCHGETGAGDGPSAATLKDFWDMPLPPRDFNTGAFRGGSTGRDLYLRIATGLAGTPMPPFGEGVISPSARWSLVLYIQSLRRKDIEIKDILAPTDQTIHAIKTEKALPVEPTDLAWDAYDTTRVSLNPLWPVEDPIPAVAVRALHDGKRLSILLQWRDPIVNGAPVRVQDFQDAAALQWSLNGTMPFLGMGDAKNPVNIWQWKAGWQQALDGPRPDVNTVYVSMHTDVYFENRALFRTAEAAGNPSAQRAYLSAVEDANAQGFGTLKSQAPDKQNVKGKGVWFDGHWNVVFIRDLESDDVDDVVFSMSKPPKVAFAIWDGQQRDRNGRKVISNWFQLVLDR